MKILNMFLVFLGLVVGNFAIASSEPSAIELVGTYTGEDQLRRACKVDVTNDGSQLNFNLVDYANNVLKFDTLPVSTIENELENDSANSYAHVVIYRYLGMPSVFGTYPETQSLTVQWNNEVVSSIWIGVEKATGPYNESFDIACFGLRRVTNVFVQ